MRLFIALAAAACAPVAGPAQGTDMPTVPVGTSAEICGDTLDNDADGAADCLDPDCDGSCAEACADTRDNDGDGAADCNDADCLGQCPEDCDNGWDDDGDGATDCSDIECEAPSCDELCTDGRDNDADGAVDCQDSDCDGDCPEACDDGRDNDGDGLTDCHDPQCESLCDEDCLNFADDDADTMVDCVDAECADQCDSDGDGALNGDHGGDDCDDADPTVHPEAIEVCDDQDNDCDGLADMDDDDLDVGTLSKWYPDSDLDTFGDTESPGIWACAADDLVANRDDCDDGDASVNPLALEVCDGLDNDCDGLRDDADPSVDLASAHTWYLDADGDGFGAAGLGIFACAPPPDYVDNADDCDDNDPDQLGPGDWVLDVDGDGYGQGPLYGLHSCDPPSDEWVSEYLEPDCNDDDASIFPDAPEVCEDGIDQDCDLKDQTCSSDLYTVRTSDDVVRIYDVLTNSFSDVGALGVGFDFGELAWDDTNSVLYMIDGRPASSLYAVNPATGKATLIGKHGVTDLFGLTWDPDLGVLWGSGESPTGFYEMDTATGKATWIGDPLVPLDGLTYDTDTHEVIGLGAGTGDVVRIDPATGKSTLLFDGPWINNCGFAYDPNSKAYYAVDWSGSVVRYDRDPVFGWSYTLIASTGTAYDGLTWVP